MSGWVSRGALLFVAVIHLLPVAGLAGVPALQKLYGVAIVGPDLEILMRHRAVLFGILGGLLAYAAFKPSLQPIAIVAGLVSVASYLGLAMTVDGANEALRRIALVDVVALVALVIAGAAWLADMRR